MRVHKKGFTTINKGNVNGEGSDDAGNYVGQQRELGRRGQSDEGHDGTFPKRGGRRWSSSGGKGTQQSTTKVTATAKTVVATTVRATTKAARATASGAMTTTVATVTTVATTATVATMTPTGNKDNKNGNSKNNDKETMTATQE